MSALRTKRPSAVERGMTLIELMVVVVIVGVLMMTAIPLLRSKPDVFDASNQVAGVLRETARKAVAAGPVANGVYAFEPDTTTPITTPDTRARLVVDFSDNTQWVALEVLREIDDSNSQWLEYSRSPVPAGVEIRSYTNEAVMTAGATPVNPIVDLKRPSSPSSGDDYKAVYCYSHGSCDPVTFYLEETNGVSQTRVAIMPLLGSPQIFNNW